MKQKIPFIILFLLSFIGVNSEFIVFSNESGNEPICENGVYQIKTADELKWFSDYVNSGFSDANAFICNDIDLSEICSENTESWIPIGRDYSVSFTGRFDGGNHTVSGLYIDGGELFNGLFGYLSGTVERVSVTGTIINNNDQGYCGGIAGYNYCGIIRGCSFNGDISLKSLSCGGLTAYCDLDGRVTNSFSVLKDKNAAACGENVGIVKYCYYLSDSRETKGDCKGVTEEDFISGEICSLMNTNQSEDIWKQKLGIDNFPVLNGNDFVFETHRCSSDDVIMYRNYNTPVHSFSENTCIDCGIKRVETIGASLVLDRAVGLKYYIRLNDMEIDNSVITLKYYDGGRSGEMQCDYEGNNIYSAVIPKYLNELYGNIITNVICLSDETVVCCEPEVNYSVLTYIDSLVLGDSEECRSLLLSLLELSGSAEKYSVGSDNLSEILSQSPWSDYFKLYKPEKYNARYQDLSGYKNSVESPSAKITHAYISVDTQINMNFYIETSETDLYLNYKNTQKNEESSVPLIWDNEKQKYKAAIDGIDAENLKDDYVLKITDKYGNDKSDTIGYNLEKYIYTVLNTGADYDAETISVCEALMNYAYYAEIYADSSRNQ